MPHSRSKSHRLRYAIVAAVLAAVIVAVAWVLIRRQRAIESPTAAVANAAGVSATREKLQASRIEAAVASEPTRKLEGSAVDAALPPPGTPLARVYDELKARADVGDAAAASRLFRDIYRCVTAREQLLGTSTAAILLEGDVSKLSAEQLAERERHLARMEARLSDAQRESRNCEGLNETQLLVTPAMLQSARLGDAGAGNCYVDGYLISDPRLFDHPEWLTEYKTNAPAIAQAAVAAGDWGAVALLQHAYARDGYAALLFGRILAPDPVQNYRYLKLRRLGANAANAPYYDRDLAYTAHDLSAEQIAAGDAWAQDTYVRHFNVAPENTIGAYNSPGCNRIDE